MHLVTVIALSLGLIIIYKWLSVRFFQHRSNIFNALLFLVLVVALSVTYFDISLREMGLFFSFDGMLYGLISSAILVLLLYIGSRFQVIRTRFKDDRTVLLSRSQAFKKATLEIPLGTVITEEVIFRGLLFALIVQIGTEWSAVLISSLLFGLWHVIDAIIFSRNNDSLGGKGQTIIATIGFTTLAGVAFAILRLVSGSLLAPILLHISANSGGLLVSWHLHATSKLKS